jgi:hypothetical protein
MSEVEQHLGDARHADAADADEVDGADLARQFHGFDVPRAAGERPRLNETNGISQFARFGKGGGEPSPGAIA